MLSFFAHLGVNSGLLHNKGSEHLMPVVFVGDNLLRVVIAALECGRGKSVSHIISAFLNGKMVLPAPLASSATLLLVIILIIIIASPSHH